MMEFKDYVPLIFTSIVTILGAYLMVRIAIAEIKKDIQHLQENLNTEIKNKEKTEYAYTATMDEVRHDVKKIFSTLTTIQVSQAKADGRDEVLAVVRESIETIAKSKK